jgi:hypothetical protein
MANSTKNFINIICLCNISDTDFIKIIESIDIKIVENTNFFNLIDNRCFDTVYLILKYINNNSIDIFNKILYQINKYDELLLNYMFYNLDYNTILKFWSDGMIKNSNLLYYDKKTKYNLFMVLIERYVFNKMYSLYDILVEYIKICPEVIKYPKKNPIFIIIIMHECKMIIIYPKEEFEAVKINIDENILKLLNLIFKLDETVINSSNYYMETPLIYAILSNHIGLINYLLDNGANINYNSYSDGSINVFETVLYSDKKVQMEFYNKFDTIDFNYYNHSLNSYAMIVFHNPEKYDDEFKLKILKYSNNLHKPNIEKQNILHLMLSNKFKDDINKYINILIQKKLNWNQQDIFGMTPLSLNADKFDTIINNILIPNYIYFINYRIKFNKLTHLDKQVIKLVNKTENVTIDDLTDEVANLIAKNIDNKVDNNNNNSILLKFQDSDYSLFTSTFTDTITYSYITLNNYQNLAVPILDFDPEKIVIECNTECPKNKNTDCLDDEAIKMCIKIKGYIKQYSKYQSIFYNNSIFWYDKSVYYIPTNLGDAINNVYNNNNKKYIFFLNVIILRDSGSNHANILIINLKKNIAIRFEPYGDVDFDSMSFFDEYMDQYLHKYYPNMNYIRNKDFCPKISFQGISGENNNNFIRIGDPPGYCLAWCFWFLESYLVHEKKIKNVNNLKIVINKLFDKIIYTYPSFLGYIREYGNFLKKSQLKIFKKLNFSYERLLSKYLLDDEYYYLMNYIDKEIYNLLL